MERKQSRLLFVVLFAFLLRSAAHAQDDNLIIRNGRVIDGTGNPAYFADVTLSDTPFPF